MTVREAYGAIAGLYINLFGTPDKVHADDLDLIARHLSGRVLDLGCGPGHLTGYLHERGADVSGVDLVPEFVEHARATHPGIDFRLGSMDDLDVTGVDGILSWYSTIHHPPTEIDTVFTGFRRALKPGGTLVLGFFKSDDLEPFDHKVTTAYRWPVDTMMARLESAGFAEIERQQRPAEDGHRQHAALAVRAVS
ncbi:SAM-dependent methyltransferase [Actinoplanes lutulentus]|uniref:Methyltransferase family protein n=1 Tax=Actinoplanes lutulentus TaxID=1287878 RepID=A0A327Z4Z6_9ACTN|nr:class I SAM-dependent methyltransferase [Actinoplanes lutulentus]MBB2949082.1 SAM-dependent methyltransferase [Actinoplanes lutulentus]RAK31403.1 methyltransferase family protein [Actinoplanes lutulentus]